MPAIRLLPTAEALSRAAAEDFVLRAARGVEASGVFRVALSGGATPRGMFTLLAEDLSLKDRVPWGKLHFFWGDERHVPPEHPESNYKAAYTLLLSRVPVPVDHIHRIHGELADADEAARRYEDELRSFYDPGKAELPVFDLIYLGLGADGHTASLFPGTDALTETERWVAANWVSKFSTYRITLTAAVINQAASVVFLVSGADKAATLKAVLRGPYIPEQLPAQLIHPASGDLSWLLDQAAAQELEKV